MKKTLPVPFCGISLLYAALAVVKLSDRCAIPPKKEIKVLARRPHTRKGVGFRRGGQCAGHSRLTQTKLADLRAVAKVTVPARFQWTCGVKLAMTTLPSLHAHR